MFGSYKSTWHDKEIGLGQAYWRKMEQSSLYGPISPATVEYNHEHEHKNGHYQKYV